MAGMYLTYIWYIWVSCCLVTKLWPTLQSHELQGLSQSLLKFKSIELMILSNNLILCSPFSFLPSSLFQHQSLFQWVSFLHEVAKLLELQLQHQSLQWIFRVDFLSSWLVWSPCSPRDSQESSPAPQFKSINSSALSLPYGPTLTSVYDYWKNHSFDYMDLCQQSDASAF